jgi:hypothetical protein
MGSLNKMWAFAGRLVASDVGKRQFGQSTFRLSGLKLGDARG